METTANRLFLEAHGTVEKRELVNIFLAGVTHPMRRYLCHHYVKVEDIWTVCESLLKKKVYFAIQEKCPT